MARKVIWAYAAEEDLEAAASYIHRDSPVYKGGQPYILLSSKKMKDLVNQ